MKEAIGGHRRPSEAISGSPRRVRPCWEIAPDMASPYGVARFLRFLGLYLMREAISDHQRSSAVISASWAYT